MCTVLPTTHQQRYGGFPVAVWQFSTAANSLILPPQSGKFAAGLGKFRNLRRESGTIGQIADFFPSSFFARVSFLQVLQRCKSHLLSSYFNRPHTKKILGKKNSYLL
jgi:hypothetical protein